MSALKFTPGPWWVDSEPTAIGRHWLVDIPGACDFMLHEGDNGEANAHLIAAAPALYAALAEAVYEISHLAPGPTEAGYSCTIAHETVERFRAALAKARGET